MVVDPGATALRLDVLPLKESMLFSERVGRAARWCGRPPQALRAAYGRSCAALSPAAAVFAVIRGMSVTIPQSRFRVPKLLRLTDRS
ncbi:hypothetical protein [Actinokineospora sp. HUAS TT18]|uniref:hypothetical protein n=1 Tax=Actinokineospora sp. HUAS TT18 TaxID=3447451 RepID=UPI003F526CC2